MGVRGTFALLLYVRQGSRSSRGGGRAPAAFLRRVRLPLRRVLIVHALPVNGADNAKRSYHLYYLDGKPIAFYDV